MPIAVHVPVLGEDHTWSLTPVGVRGLSARTDMVSHARWCSCSNSRRGLTWSLMPVGVRVPVSGEDHTRSLTPTIVSVLDPGDG